MPADRDGVAATTVRHPTDHSDDATDGGVSLSTWFMLDSTRRQIGQFVLAVQLELIDDGPEVIERLRDREARINAYATRHGASPRSFQSEENWARRTERLADVDDKVYTRDIYGTD